jgi:hypothetical protein
MITSTTTWLILPLYHHTYPFMFGIAIGELGPASVGQGEEKPRKAGNSVEEKALPSELKYWLARPELALIP